MVTTPMSLAGTVARAGAGLALDAGGKVATVPLRAVESGVQWAAAGTEALLPETTVRLREETVRWRDDLIDLIDPRPDRTHRRVDLHEQRATVEVRGLDGDRAPDIAEALGKRLDRLRAVRWWEINSVTGRVVAALADGAADLPAFLAEVERTERDTDVADRDWSRRAEFPADREPLLATTIQVAGDLAALGVAAAGLLIPGKPPTRVLRAAATLTDTQPRLRKVLEERLGRPRTDLLLSITNAVGNALNEGAAEGVVNLVVDTVQRSIMMTEAITRHQQWRAWEHTLTSHDALAVDQPLPAHERPAEMPKGPVERVADETAAGALAGAGAFGIAGRLGPAASALELGAPKAARATREAYAAAASTTLARAGVLTLHPGAWRRFDRLSVLVVDGESLLTRRRMVLDAEAVDPHWRDPGTTRRADPAFSRDGSADRTERATAMIPADEHPADAPTGAATPGQDTAPADSAHSPADEARAAAHVWTAAQRLLHEQEKGGAAAGGLRLVHPDTGSPDRGATLRPAWRELRDGDRVVGRVLVGRELDRRAHAVLTAARNAGLRVVLVGGDDVAELRTLADEFRTSAGSMSAVVHRAQEDGHVVAVLSPRAYKALAWADVAIGLSPVEHGCPRPPWSSDIVCRDLVQVQRVLAAVGPARQASERGRALALSGAALAALLLAIGPEQRGRTSPIVTAHVLGLLNGAVGGWQAVRRQPRDDLAPLLPWHALGPGEVVARLPEPPGLDERAEAQRSKLGAALAPLAPAVSFGRQLRRELADPLTPILGVGAVATAILGSPSDAILLSSVLTVNAVVSARQRQRAEHALQDLMADEELTARLVGRSGDAEQVIPAHRLRVGDLIRLRAGDVVPADARLIELDDLELDESGLTGESVTVEKQLAATPGAALGDRACMVFEGSTVVSGAGTAVVVAVGADTQAGRAAAGAMPPEKGGVQAQLRRLTDRALPLTLAGGTAVTALGGLRRQPLRTAIADGVGVAVAAVPEGLPLVATVAQLAAARRLSRFGVLVRASRTVEALGRVDTLCFDKTGTLTEGKLRLTTLADLDEQWEPDTDSDRARRLLRAAARACPDPADGPVLHATDRAVLDAAEVLGDEAHRWDPIEEIPFESNRGYAAAIGQTTRRLRLVVKGAPEVVLPRCSKVRTGDQPKQALTEELRERAVRRVAELAEQGLRVLVVARRDLADRPEDMEDAVGELTLLGFLGLADTPRPQTVPLVKSLQDNGIGVRMITGDHPVTAAAVAKQLGIEVGEVTTGADLDRLDETAQIERIERSTVFARVSPEHKVRIVAALRKAGHVVGMTGDGSNDAAAIRTADVGIGLAAHGSAAARNAADMVLTDADPTALLHALVEGRGMWQRISAAVGVLVGGNAGEVAFTLYGTAVSGHAPLGTRQFLLVNMLTDMFPALALALAQDRETAAGVDTAQRAAQLSEIPPAHLGAELAHTIAVRGLATAAGAAGAWTVGRFVATPRRAATIGLVALIGTQLGQTLVSGHRSPGVWLTTAVSGAVLCGVVMTPGVCHYFGCTPLGPLGWTIATTSAVAATAGSIVLPRVLPNGLLPNGALPAAPASSDADPQ
ncbi:cation-translocating P-type ATPase [Nocardia farcinica]|uniref:cation-translocating P-type ATPase n=1 Tax=Nocardia farcinica TaxID=37329 RepID=UPI0011159A6C|nr:cation-translocating P-type ATPase [Nocardia farcinica]MBF6249540.1 cation-translocating P-type ATPase [Nocardia farcinica]